MEIVQTSQDALPTVAAIPPIENSTSTGTPLATQKAPVQSIFRCRLCPAPSAISPPLAATAVIATPRSRSRTTLPHPSQTECSERSGVQVLVAQLYALGP